MRRPMMFCLCLGVYLSLWGTLPAGAENKPLVLGIEHVQYLPPAMYGEWSVNATLLETDMPEIFAPVVHDLWVLDRSGDQVTVTNPANGASAAISVDRVEGDTATFHRQVVVNNRVLYESPTITVNGDTLQGTTEHRYELIKKGVVRKVARARYALVAERIGGARIKFGNPLPAEALEFEIAPVEQQQAEPRR